MEQAAPWTDLITNLRVPSSLGPPMGALVIRHDATCRPDSCLGSANPNLRLPQSLGVSSEECKVHSRVQA